MIERTEELGLAAALPITVGGNQVVLRTLNLDESEKWQAKLGTIFAKFDLPSSDDPAAVFAAFLNQPTALQLELFLAYDVDKQLGTATALRKKLTQRELYDGLKQMVTAELPFVTDARSVAEAFGPQIRAIASTLVYRAIGRMTEESPPANSTNGPSPTGESTPQPSASDSPRNGSSSSGNTGSSERGAKPTRRPSRPRSQAPTPMQT